MTETVTRQAANRVARPLKVLVPLIQQELSDGNQAGLEHYRQAGEMLLEAREQVPVRGWTTWLSKNFTLSRMTAYRYMKLAETPQRTARDTSIRQVLGQPYGAEPGVRRSRKIRDFINNIVVDDFAQDQQQHNDEIKLHRDLAEQLIDIGYRALATRLHPDRGGSKEAMSRLNRVRDELKAVAETRRFL